MRHQYKTGRRNHLRDSAPLYLVEGEANWHGLDRKGRRRERGYPAAQ
jgi:hypothetical protein